MASVLVAMFTGAFPSLDESLAIGAEIFSRAMSFFDGRFRHCLSEPHYELRLNGQNDV